MLRDPESAYAISKVRQRNGVIYEKGQFGTDSSRRACQRMKSQSLAEVVILASCGMRGLAPRGGGHPPVPSIPLLPFRCFVLRPLPHTRPQLPRPVTVRRMC